MTIDLEAVKAYCRIDGDEEDTLLLSLIDAAKDYLDGSGIHEPEEDNPLYALCVNAIVLDYYDHRGMAEAGTMTRIPGLDNAIVQLKLRAEAERIVEVEEDGLSGEPGQ